MSEFIVWHDLTCPLRRREIDKMRRLDRAGAVHLFNVTVTKDAACPVDRDASLVRLHANNDNQPLSGAAAFAAMWRTVLLLRLFGLAVCAPFALAIVELAYRFLLKVHPHFQHLAMRGQTI